MRHLILTLIAVVTVGACTEQSGGSTQVFIAKNRYQVYPTSDPAVFEVVGKSGASGTQYFCAAADYAYVKAGAAPADRVVVSRPLGPSIARPGSKSVLFSVAPNGSLPPPNAITMRVNQVGINYQVASSRQLCQKPNDRRDK